MRRRLQRRHGLLQRLTGHLARREREHDRPLRVFRDGQGCLPGELAGASLPGLPVGRRALHERVHGHRRHHHGDADERLRDPPAPAGSSGGVAIDSGAARTKESPLVFREPEGGVGCPRFGQLEPAAGEQEAGIGAGGEPVVRRRLDPPAGEQILARFVDPAP